MSSPSRREDPVSEREEAVRVYLCGRCRQTVFICRSCDRGHRYCSNSCSEKSRRESVRAAGRRHQRSECGRKNNCRRQQLLRERRRGTREHAACTRSATASESTSSPPDSGRVTHHTSSQAQGARFSLTGEPEFVRLVTVEEDRDVARCHFCGFDARGWVRRSFLGARRRPRDRSR